MKNLGRYNNDLSIPRKQDVDGKQDKISVSGVLKGDGNGNISAAETVEGTASTVPSGLLKGSNGEIVQAEAGTDYMVPVAVTAEDNGKILQVVNGVWAAADLPTYDGGVS